MAAMQTHSRISRVAVVLVAGLVAVGCGSDGGKDTKTTKTTERKVATTPAQAKEYAVENAEARVKKNPNDKEALRELARAYIAAASPESGKENPKDREKLLKKSIKTLEKLRDLDPADQVTLNMLATSYMAVNDAKKALPIRRDLAKQNRKDANAQYAWGLTASAAGETDEAITAWKKFLRLAPPKDPRVKQVTTSIDALQKAEKQKAAAPEKGKEDAGADDTKDSDK